MLIGIDQLHLSDLRPAGARSLRPTITQIDQGRLYGLEVLSPIRVRKTPFSTYEILAGVTTWMVAQRLRIDDVKVECLEMDNEAASQLLRDEYAQSTSIDPITQAEHLQNEIRESGVKRRELCERYGISRSNLSHLLRLLQLDPTVQALIRNGNLSTGKGKALVGLPGSVQRQIANEAVNDQLSTRDVEEAVRSFRAGSDNKLENVQSVHAASKKDSNILSLEQSLSEKLGSPVTITSGDTPSRGELTIKYFSLEELQNVIDRLEYNAHSDRMDEM